MQGHNSSLLNGTLVVDGVGTASGLNQAVFRGLLAYRANGLERLHYTFYTDGAGKEDLMSAVQEVRRGLGTMLLAQERRAGFPLTWVVEPAFRSGTKQEASFCENGPWDELELYRSGKGTGIPAVTNSAANLHRPSYSIGKAKSMERTGFPLLPSRRKPGRFVRGDGVDSAGRSKPAPHVRRLERIAAANQQAHIWLSVAGVAVGAAAPREVSSI